MTNYFSNLSRAFLGDRRGVTAMEYAILAGVIATVILGGFKVFGGDLSTALATIASLIPTS